MHYNKLLNCLEEDATNIKYGFRGEVMEAYRAIVQQEIIKINQNITLLKRRNNT